MAFIPYENINYETELKFHEIIKILNSIIEPRKIIRILSIFNDNLKPYEGEINNNKFKICKIIRYRNSFNPIIYGTINNENNVTKINLKMKLHSFVKIFMIIWLGFTCITFLTGLIGLILNTEAKYSLPFGIGMMVFGYLLMTFGFKYESKKSKEYFKTLFKAKIIIKNANST